MKKEKKSVNKHGLLLGVLSIFIVVCVVAVVVQLVLNAKGNAGADKLYWNIDGGRFLNEAGLSDREAEEDGSYKIVLAVDGEQKEYEVTDKALVDKVDNRDLMGLVVSGRGIITEVLDPEEVTGGEVVSKWFILSADNEKIVVSDTGDDGGLTYTLKLTEDTGIYDVTGSEPVGHSTTLKEGDCVRVFKNKAGKIRYVFVVNAEENTFEGNVAEKYCDHCGKSVTWYEWTEIDTLPSGSGHWCLMNDVNLVREQELDATMQIVLDLNGKTVNGCKNQRVYNVNHEGCTLILMDSSVEGTGSLKGYGYPKNGGVVYLQDGNLELYSGTIDASEINTDSFGAALRVNANTTFKMHGGTIIGGVTNRVLLGSGSYAGGAGGAVYVASNAVFTMYDGTIRDGKAITYQKEDGSYTMGMGGNIYLSTYATFVMEGGKILNGAAERFGGNVYVGTDSTFTMSGGLLEAGNAERGGNIYLNTKSSMDMSDGTIQLGSASEQGGNICGWGKNKLSLSGGTIKDGEAVKRGGNISTLGEILMSGGAIQGGKATSTAGDNNNGIGGNVYVAVYGATEDGKKVYYRGCLNVTGGTISDGQTAYSRGGNVYLGDRADLIIGEKGIIENGVSAVSGGNIFAQKDSTITVNKGAIIRNGTAGKNGGNINTGTEITVNINGGEILNGVADSGGNIYCGGRGVLNLVNGTIRDGKAVTRGGNICSMGTIVMTGGKVTAGKATSTKGDNNNGIGGNIYTAAYMSEENGKEVYYRSKLEVSGGTISDGVSEYSRGGNVYLAEQADFILKDKGLVENGNSAVSGGNIFAQNDSTITLNGGTIQNGSAKVNGGNINTGIGIAITMNGGKVLKGTANSGGNLYCGGTSVLKIMAGSISEGTAVTRGGNICSMGKIVMTGGKVTAGKATSTKGDNKNGIGGNVYLAAYESTKDGVTTYTRATLKVLGGVISDGISEHSRGGNVYLAEQADFIVSDQGLITNGTSAVSGGNVFVQNDSTITMNGGAIQCGSASKDGGNICAGNDIKITLNSGDISEGIAERGGNLYCGGRSTLTIKNGSVSNGKAVVRGGNISTLGNIVMFGGAIRDGKVTGDEGIGGNVYVASYTNNGVTYLSTFDIAGGTIQGGSALSAGGNVYMSSGKLTMNGGELAKGAAQNGGNIYLGSTASMIMTSGQIEAGTAVVSGGNIYADADITMTGGEITGGTATSTVGNNSNGIGGNIFLLDHTLKIKGGTISGGTSEHSRGGNLYMRGATLVLNKGGSIKNGVCAVNGGNIMAEKASVININGGTISGGKSGDQGGNIRIGSSTLIMRGGSIINGKAAENGGNVYVDKKSAVTMESGKISITGGKKENTVVSNLYLDGNVNINIGTLSSGSSIGVAVSGDRVFAENAKQQYVSYFFADNSEKNVMYHPDDKTLSIQ